ncbi:MAG TPA: DUF695 domain-containing protein [Chryseolinea sp.]|nr:DUF695 domain-containing protein [Chryseolinea sp.]
MKRFLFRVLSLALFLVTTLVTKGRAQAAWDAYLARYDGGLGSVVLSMDVARTAPRHDLPFLLITGVTFQKCTGDGFPERRELKRMNRLSDDINRELFAMSGSKQAQALLVGTFTHQCQRLDYIYLADTTGIREALERFEHKRGYATYNFHIRLIEDPEWDAYRNFLYPNDGVRTFMMNNRAITRMTDAGDALSRPRFVEHLIYFDTIKDRELFIRYIARIKYDIKEERDMRRDSLRYQVRLAKFGTVSLEEMNDQTAYLSTKAREFGGVYDGWETKLIGTKQRFHLLYNSLAEPTNTAK